jgi:hypothetical protein
MSLNQLYFVAGLKIRNVVDDEIVPLHVTDNTNLNYNQTFYQHMQEALPDPSFSTVMGMRPDITCTTTQIQTCLGTIGLNGLKIDEEDDAFGWTLAFLLKKGANLGNRIADATGVHLEYYATKGLLYMTGGQFNHQQPSTIDLRFVPVWNGTNAPLVYSGVETIDFDSANQGMNNDIYTLDSVKFGSTVIQGNINVGLQMNQQMIEQGADSDLYTSFCCLGTRSPVFRFTGHDIDNYTTTFRPQGPTSMSQMILYLRRKTKYGEHRPKTDTVHASLTCAYNHWTINQVSGSAGQPGTAGYEVRPIINAIDGNIIQLATGIAIP